AGPPAKSDGEDRPGRFKTRPERAFLHEREFTADPRLVATPSQLVVLELERGANRVESTYRYTLASGRYRVCVEGEITSIAVADAQDRTLALVDRATGCRELAVAKGVYQITVTHDGTALTSGSHIAFASSPKPEARLLVCPGGFYPAYTCTPRDGYVVVALGGSFPVLHAQPGGAFSCDGGHPRSGEMPLVFGDPFSVDEYALVRFGTGSVDPSDPSTGPHLLFGTTPLGIDPVHCSSDGSYGIYAGNVTDPTKNSLVSHKRGFPPDNIGLYLDDQQYFHSTDYRLELGAYSAHHQWSVWQAYTSNNELRSGTSGGGAYFTPFRYLPSGGDTTPLDPGEVALFRECGYKGPATVFVVDQSSLAQWSSGFLPLDKTTRSVRLGSNTSAVLYPSSSFTGAPQTLDVDTPCLASPAASSLRIGDVVSLLLTTTRTCVGCNLTGVDLSGADLSGYVLSGARLNGANLSRAKLANAVLDHASLANARLNGADLSNAELSQANLSGAFLNADPPNKILSAAVLIGAHLKNVNLASAELDGADFTSATFYATNPAGSGTCVPAASGFTASCATASGASAVGTVFTGAYLAGVDFTGAHFTGPDFTYAVLAGANFTGATLAPRDGAGRAGFAAAHLQGTQLGGVNDIQGVSFEGAFLDFTVGGNALFLQLDGTHTAFAGRKNAGRSVCVLAPYSSATTVPAANTTITCADGHAGPCGAGTPGPPLNLRWASARTPDLATPPVWYAAPPTYPSTSGAAQLCSLDDVDPDW
ncbi:MAG: pentapeptide repeat-containing protein, partial [Thermoanaerobaculia bacterium]